MQTVYIYAPDEETPLDAALYAEEERIRSILAKHDLNFLEQDHPATYIQKLTTFYFGEKQGLSDQSISDFDDYYEALIHFVKNEALLQYAHESDFDYVARLAKRFNQAAINRIPGLMADFVLEVIDRYDPEGQHQRLVSRTANFTSTGETIH